MNKGTEEVHQSIRDQPACESAAKRAKRGEVIGSYIRGVCGLWVDGANAEAVDRIYEIKGERREGRPLGTTLDGDEFTRLVDPDQIASSAVDLFLNPQKLSRRLGSLCFIRIPILRQPGSELPSRLVSQTEDGTYWLQNWIPEGCRSSQVWMEELRRQRIELPVATSMNISGEPELVEQSAGVEFCLEHGIPVFLGDPQSTGEVKGSFPIIQVDKTGVRLIREGHFPGRLFENLMQGWDIDVTGFQPAKHPVVGVPPEFLSGSVDGAELRLALIEHLDG